MPEPLRLATVSAGGRTRWGAVRGGKFAALDEPHPQWPSLRAAIAGGGLPDLPRDAAITHQDFTYQIPIPDPEKIICVGVNYPARNDEYRDGKAAPENMSLFVRFPRSFTGHDQPLIRPHASHMLDYEGEVAIVIGSGGRHIPEKAALDNIAALTLANDGTLRDWVRHAKFNVTQGKNFDASGAIGPWLTPFTDPAQIDDIALATRVNGDTRQSDRTSRMLFPVARQIAYISTFTTLSPGDIILTGTPTGAGARLDPPQFLQPDDVVEVEADGLGILRNTVMDEA